MSTSKEPEECNQSGCYMMGSLGMKHMNGCPLSEKEPEEYSCVCEMYIGNGKVYMHLLGCPQNDYSICYQKSPWYKKLFMRSPSSFLPTL